MDTMQGLEWQEWQQHQQTKAFLQLLHQSVQAIQVEWCNRQFVSDDPYKSTTLNSAALGKIEALGEIINAIETIGASNAQ